MYLYMCIYTYPRWGGLHINNYNNELANKVKIEATSKLAIANHSIVIAS